MSMTVVLTLEVEVTLEVGVDEGSMVAEVVADINAELEHARECEAPDKVVGMAEVAEVRLLDQASHPTYDVEDDRGADLDDDDEDNDDDEQERRTAVAAVLTLEIEVNDRTSVQSVAGYIDKQLADAREWAPEVVVGMVEVAEVRGAEYVEPDVPAKKRARELAEEIRQFGCRHSRGENLSFLERLQKNDLPGMLELEGADEAVKAHVSELVGAIEHYLGVLRENSWSPRNRAGGRRWVGYSGITYADNRLLEFVTKELEYLGEGRRAEKPSVRALGRALSEFCADSYADIC